MTAITSSPAEPNDDAARSPDEARAPKRFLLPSASYDVRWSARRIFAALARRFSMFVHAGVVVEIAFTGKDRAELREISPSMFRSRVEEIGELWRDAIDNKGQKISRQVCLSQNL